MEFLREALKSVRRLDDEPTDQPADDELDLDAGSDDPDAEPTDDDELDLDAGDDEDMPPGMSGQPDGGAPFNAPAGGGGGFSSASGSKTSGVDGDQDDEFDLDGGDDDHPELDGVGDDAASDPDRQGLIRTVKNAHLVYKRDTEDGTFEELWIYNVDTLRDELNVKKAILAGTDIPINKTTSPDGSQSYEIWSAGNAEMIVIKGLPN